MVYLAKYLNIEIAQCLNRSMCLWAELCIAIKGLTVGTVVVVKWSACSPSTPMIRV